LFMVASRCFVTHPTNRSGWALCDGRLSEL
jgi:hypothetical protein